MFMIFKIIWQIFSEFGILKYFYFIADFILYFIFEIISKSKGLSQFLNAETSFT